MTVFWFAIDRRIRRPLDIASSARRQPHYWTGGGLRMNLVRPWGVNRAEHAISFIASCAYRISVMPRPEPIEQSLTAILARVDEGDQQAVREILPVVYDELRSMAAALFANERAEHSLQPTALVHEAYLRLAARLNERFRDRRQFFALAAKVMRQVLTDHARAARALKRGRDWGRVTLNPLVSPLSGGDIDIEALDAAMNKLAAFNARHAQIVEYRFLAGFTVDEVAELLGVSPRTVELDWRAARAWLRLELGERDV